MGDIRRSYLPKSSMQAFSAKSAVVTLNHPFRITLSDCGRIGVHRVQEKLHRCRAATLQIAGIVVGDDHSSVEITPADRITKLLDGKIITSHAKAFAFRQGRHKLPAL